MENFIEKVFDLRNQGLAMWEIAARIWDDNYDGDRPAMSSEEANHILYRCGTTKEKAEAYEARTFYLKRKKEYEKLLYGEDGVYDILMKSADGYDTDGISNLINAISKQAANDYGEGRTTELETGKPCKSFRFVTAKGYFLKGKYDELSGAMVETNESCPTGKDILDGLDRQAEEGRWIEYKALEFESKKEAQKLIDKYPIYAGDYIPVKVKGAWKLVLKQEVNDK